jgi:hypothetical protein
MTMTKIVTDCTTGQGVEYVLSPEEEAEERAKYGGNPAEEAEQQRSAAMERVRGYAKEDPRFADLLIVLGLE